MDRIKVAILLLAGLITGCADSLNSPQQNKSDISAEDMPEPNVFSNGKADTAVEGYSHRGSLIFGEQAKGQLAQNQIGHIYDIELTRGSLLSINLIVETSGGSFVPGLYLYKGDKLQAKGINQLEAQIGSSGSYQLIVSSFGRLMGGWGETFPTKNYRLTPICKSSSGTSCSPQ